MRNPWRQPERPAVAAPEPTLQEARSTRLRELGKEIARARSEFETLEERASTIRFKIFQCSRGVPVGLTSEEHDLQTAMSELRVKLSRLLNEYSILSSNPNETVHREGKLIHA